MAAKNSIGNLGSLFFGNWKRMAFLNKYFLCMVWEISPIAEYLKLFSGASNLLYFSDEQKKKAMLRSWALNFWDFTSQPIDDIYLYFGTKASWDLTWLLNLYNVKQDFVSRIFTKKVHNLQIAIYFAFLGMYTRWLLFPAALGIVLHIVDFGYVSLS